MSAGAISKCWAEGFDSGKRPAIRIRFATGTRAPCPVRNQCTSSHRCGRQLTVRPQEQNAPLQRVRAEQAAQEWEQRHAAR
ncbi:transposase, partial [Saccharothrix coeruleofusca]|uniref:transposase n=1 Tax=Saccharothrix coeruleofusca TaxID=33919 RepID=UPI00166FAC15